MHFLLVAFALACAASAAPSGLVSVHKYNGQVKSGSYIVTLNSDAPRKEYLSSLKSKFSNVSITHDNWEGPFDKVFSAKLNAAALASLRSDPSVKSIEEDGMVTASLLVTNPNAPWGLGRISRNTRLTSSNPNLVNFQYRFDSTAGAGVDIYIVDTGIYTAHSDFSGRARWGATFGGYPSRDGHGHGTHCAGTAAGTRYGVAKLANLIAVKVLSDTGSGWTSDIIAGLNYVANSARVSRRPTVVSMSLGGSASPSLDNAVAALTSMGIHVVVAAGNDGQDARFFSPARAPSAITVGATSINDDRASFSNFGSVVDIFAPGVSIPSTWIGSTNAVRSLSGTSMATPHVAGLVAYFLRIEGNLPPHIMSQRLKQYSVKNAITGIPAGTVNHLARNNIV